MHRREFLKSCLTVAAAAAGSSVAKAGTVLSNSKVNIKTNKNKPNVVLIVADDLGYSDIGCFQNPSDPNYIDTTQLDFSPNIDYIAENGVKLTDFYAHPVCTPTRCCALSGLHLKRSLDIHNLSIGGVLHENDDTKGFNKHSIADSFKSAGYTTACLGKWHLGDGYMLQTTYPPQPPFSTVNPFHPNDAGFDYFYGFLGGSIDYVEKYVRGKTFDWFEQRTMLWEDDGNGNNTHEDADRYATHINTEKAVEFINNKADAEEPFFLYLAYTPPHWAQTAVQDDVTVHQLPNEEEIPPGEPGHDPALYRKYLSRSDAYLGTDDTNIRKRLIAMVSCLDDGIGEVLQTLRDHNIEGNTIVIFVSDNGGETEYPNYVQPGGVVHYGSSNYPWREDKGTLWEGGIRVPAIFMYQGHTAANQTSSQLASVVDLKATIASLAGVNMSGIFTDGIDLSPNLANPDQTIEHDIFLSSKFRGKVYRKGDYKYVRRHDRGSDTGVDELYNLAADPHEDNDIASSNPTKLNELKTLCWDKFNSM